MITDPVFYRLFATSPETFFLMLGMSAESAREMAARFQYEAIEFKTTSQRVDGVFLPKEAGLPIYFLEAQRNGHRLQTIAVKSGGDSRHQEKLKAIAEMAALKISPMKIAKILELDIKLVRKELAKRRP